MSELQQLEVTAGNTVALTLTTDIEPTGISASIVDANLNEVVALVSNLYEENGAVATIDGVYVAYVVLTPEVTVSARSKGTILQVRWEYGTTIQNSRINVVGVLEAGVPA